jgi:hypothetical protein
VSYKRIIRLLINLRFIQLGNTRFYFCNIEIGLNVAYKPLTHLLTAMFNKKRIHFLRLSFVHVGNSINHLFVLASSLEAGLPDGLFSNQNSKFGEFLEGLSMEDVGIFR